MAKIDGVLLFMPSGPTGSLMSMPKVMVVIGDGFRRLGAIPEWLVVACLSLMSGVQAPDSNGLVVPVGVRLC